MARRRCVTCDQPIRFMANVSSGHAIPVDLSADEHGTIRAVTSGAAVGKTTWNAHKLTGAELLDAQAGDELLFTDHRDTCSGTREHNPMPAEARALRDALPAPRTAHRRRTRP